jgi:SAM-dependent methyltransferase
MTNDRDARETNDRRLFNSIANEYARKDVIPSTRRARKSVTVRACAPILEENGTLGFLVDVGCGIGMQALYLEGCYSKYLGIDYSENLITIGKKMLADTSSTELVCANIKDPLHLEEKADTILAVGALHHMTDIVAAMESLRALAKPGANFIAIEPQCGNPLIQVLRRVRGSVDKNYSNEQIYFDPKELDSLLAEVGMTNRNLEYQGFLTPPFSQAALRPEFIWNRLSKCAVLCEPIVEKILPKILQFLSWNVVVYAKFSK